MKQYELPKARRVAALAMADKELRRNHEAGIIDEGDPNHPMYNGGLNYTKLFGRSWEATMALQNR